MLGVMRVRYVMGMIGCLVCCQGYSAAESGLQVHGALQMDAIARHRLEDGFDRRPSYAGLNLFSLDFRSVQTIPAKVEGSVDLFFPFGDYAGLYSPSGVGSGAESGAEPGAESGTEPGEESATQTGSSEASLLAYVRRLYAALYFPAADITLGRQIINFGTGRLFSPLDVFSPVNLFDIALRRSGSDIAMATIPIGDLSGIDAVAEFPLPGREQTSALKGYTNWNAWDLSLVGMYRHLADEVIGGVSFRGDAIVGLYGEVVERFNRNTERWSFESMAGADYSIAARWLFAAEYLFRQRDLRLDPLRDRHNLYASAQYLINDLSSLTAVVIASLPAQRTITTLQYANNLLARVDTFWYLRYYQLDLPEPLVPDGEAGMRVAVRF